MGLERETRRALPYAWLRLYQPLVGRRVAESRQFVLKSGAAGGEPYPQSCLKYQPSLRPRSNSASSKKYTAWPFGKGVLN